MLLIAVAKLSPKEWDRVSFRSRCELLNEYYGLDKVKGLSVYKRYFPQTGIGVFAAYKSFQGLNVSFGEVSDGLACFVSHLPFGSSTALSAGAPGPRSPIDISNLLVQSPGAIASLNPPITVWRINEADGSVEFWNDCLGLAKTFVLETDAGKVFSSRPVAAHLFAMRNPSPDEMGWAAEQLLGWYISDSTPYSNLKRCKGGSHAYFDAQGLSLKETNYAATWFHEAARSTSQETFSNFSQEFNQFSTTELVDTALSGGRDSRASAALAAYFFPGQVRFRTNEPPKLEGIIARQLIEKLGTFDRFNKDQTRAFDTSGRVIWAANVPKVSEIEFADRARGWVDTYEGMAASVAIYNSPPQYRYFSPEESFAPSIAGAAGESAKAYYWSPRMLSGAYAVHIKRFIKDIKSTHISERLLTHPLTKLSDYPFVSNDFREVVSGAITDEQSVATEHDIHGYRFLDYWWLTNRFGAGATIAYAGITTVMPFMATDYIRRALQMAPVERAQSKLLDEITLLFQPNWKDIDYFDQAQFKAPVELKRYHREQSLLWEGKLKKPFFEILHNSSALGYPYNRSELIRFFSKVDVPSTATAGLNIKALGLVHRHYFAEFCENISRNISEHRKP